MQLADFPAAEWARVQRLRELALLDTPAEELFDGFTRLAAGLCALPYALICLVDAERIWTKSAHGQPRSEGPREHSPCDAAIRHAAPFEVEDVPADPRFRGHPCIDSKARLAQYVGIPLTLPDGHVIGTLCVAGPRPGRIESRQRELLVELAAGIVRVMLLREREANLQRSKNLLDAARLTELVPVGMFSTDAQGRVVHGNRHWAGMISTGAREHLLGDGWISCVHPDDLGGMLEGYRAAVAGRKSYAGVVRVHGDAEGGLRWIKFRLSPVTHDLPVAPGRPGKIAFIGATVDITDRMQLASELQARNALLQSILENLPCGVTVFDARLRHVITNGEARRLLELPPGLFERGEFGLEDMLRQLALRGEFGPGPSEWRVRELLASARTLAARTRERVCADGTVVEIRGGVMPDGSLISLCSDVTAVRRAAAELSTSETRLARALGAAGLGLWEFDLVSRTVYLSTGWARLIGLPHADRIVRHDEMLPFMVPEEAASIGQASQRLLKGHEDLLSLEHRLLTPAGVIWVLTEAQVSERAADGRVMKVVGTSKNITPRREAAAALNAALRAADEANRAKSEFLATMSHEIRTPLNGVIGLTQLLAAAPLPPMEGDSVRMIDSCAKSLLSLVDNILDLSKIEAGKLTLEEVPTELTRLLEEVADVFTVRAAEKGLRFSLAIAPEVPRWVHADPGRLRQILLNLLGNALKFTAEGGFSLIADMEKRGGSPEKLRLRVRDSGIGIAEADHARLFTRFTQIDASATRKYEGTGLGLAIARQLAQLMNGEITLESRPAEGSTFTVVLPLRRAVAPLAAHETSLSRPVAAGSRILLVEDNDVNRLVAGRMLDSLGYHDVTAVCDGQQAVNVCRTEPPFAVVLMDCQMPVMDGLQATRELRRLGFGMPIIAFTAGATSSDRERCMSAGMTDYLSKPIELPVLADKIERAVAGVPESDCHKGAFDSEVLMRSFLGNPRLFAEARTMFLAQTGRALAELAAAVETGDAERMRFLAHRVRGSALTVGAIALSQACGELELGVRPPADRRAVLERAQAALTAYAHASETQVAG